VYEVGRKNKKFVFWKQIAFGKHKKRFKSYSLITLLNTFF